MNGDGAAIVTAAHSVWLSIVRTWVPYIVGGVVGVLASIRVELDADTVALMTGAFTIVGGLLWWSAGRALEVAAARWPRLAFLRRVAALMLGSSKPPTYQ